MEKADVIEWFEEFVRWHNGEIAEITSEKGPVEVSKEAIRLLKEIK